MIGKGRWARGGAVLVAGLLVLGGCGDDVRRPSVPDDAGPHPAVTPRQAAMILGAVDAALVRAVTARNMAAAGSRALGPAREALNASIAVDRALERTSPAPPSPTTPKLLLTRSEGWPRWFMTAGATPASATPLLQVLTSPDPRSPYGLWGRLTLLPGTRLPDTASAATGAVPLGPTAPGLVKTPAEVIAHYTELLNRGDSSAYKGDFAPDAYRTELNDQLAADRKLILTSGAGQVTASHTSGTQPPFALPTQDGGALVVGRIDQRYVVTVAAGRKSVRLDPQLAALAGRPVVATRVERRSVEVLAFYVPKAGSRAQVNLIAASRTDVAATGS